MVASTPLILPLIKLVKFLALCSIPLLIKWLWLTWIPYSWQYPRIFLNPLFTPLLYLSCTFPKALSSDARSPTWVLVVLIQNSGSINNPVYALTLSLLIVVVNHIWDFLLPIPLRLKLIFILNLPLIETSFSTITITFYLKYIVFKIDVNTLDENIFSFPQNYW